MNHTKLYLALFLALLLAGGASLLVSQRLQQAEAKTPVAQIVVAAKDLELGAALTPEDLKVISWTGDVPKGAFTAIADTTGRAVLYPMYANEAILDAKLAPVGSGAGMTAVIPQGMRAVSIRVDEVVAVAGFVGPGTHVDVLLTGESGTESVTKTILQNIQVLAAGQKIQPDAQGRAEKVNVVTLLCSSEDAAKVTLAANDGRIQLLLRNPMDVKETQKVASVGRRSLFGEATPVVVRTVRVVEKPKVVLAAPAPVAPPPPPVVVAPPPPPPPTTVIVIRGDRVSTVEVRDNVKGITN
ncbi:MAG: Flp pilus assembly protein CpaB [Acidobacteriota bacterium]